MKTRRKKLVKNVFIFIAMFMIVGMYIVPVTSNAGQVAKDGDLLLIMMVRKDIQILRLKTQHLQLECTVNIQIVIIHIITQKYILKKMEVQEMRHMAYSIHFQRGKQKTCQTGLWKMVMTEHV